MRLFQSRKRTPTRLCQVCAMLLVLLTPSTLRANPSGGQVTSGQATFVTNGNTLNITTSDQVSINWQSFSIASGETTQFFQPNSQSLAINRVLTGNPSALYGTLRANGQIMLINPNGIVVGAGGVIDTGGFVGSTLDLPDDQIFSGDWEFSGGKDNVSIENFGTINANGGDVVLISREINNAGTITAPNGKVALAAGKEVLLARKDDATQGIYVRPEAGSGSINNSGTIEAMEVEMEAAGGNPYAFAIQNTGTIRAVGFDKSGGRVRLLGHEGMIRLAGDIKAGIKDKASDVVEAVGGLIEATAPEVIVVEGTTIDASGLLGGGQIHIGGNFQGQGPLPNADRVIVEFGVRIKADAIEDGDGGTIIIWSDGHTGFGGALSARGAGSGNGGFAEVSGKQTLAFRGTADLAADNGIGGSLLLDPDEIIISAVGTDDAELADNQILFTDGGAFSTFSISTGSIETLLNAGTDVLLQANDTITLQVGNTITATGAGALELNATNLAININGDIDIGGDLTMTTGGVITLGAGVSVQSGGTITATQNGTLSIGNLTAADGVTLTSNVGGINVTGDISGGTGNIDLNANAAGGSITLAAAVGLTTSGNIEMDAGSDILLDAGATINATGTGSVTLNAAQSITLTAGATSISATTGDIVLNANVAAATGNFDGIALRNGSSITTTTGAITLTATGGTSANNEGMILDGTTISSTDGAIALNGTGVGVNNEGIFLNNSTSVTSDGSSAITLTGTANSGVSGVRSDNTSSIGGASATGDITINTNEIDLATGTSIQGSGSLTIAPTTAATTIGIGGGTGTLNLTAAEIATLTDGFSSITIGDTAAGTGAVDVNAVTFTDNVTIVGGAIDVEGLDAGTNTATITARTGAITDGTGTAVTGSTVTLNAAGAIGANPNAFGVAADSLVTDTSASNGDQFFIETDGLTAINLNAGAGDVSLRSGGAVTDTDGATDVTATSAAISADGNIGTSANALNLVVSQVAAEATAAGDVFVSNTGALTVTTLSGITGLSTVGSDIGVTSTGDVNISSNLLARNNGNITVTSGGTITTTADVKSVAATSGSTGDGAGNITFTADSMTLTSGSISATGGGTLTLAPQTASTTIGLGGGAGTLNLTDAEILLFADGFSSIVIGLAAGTGAVDLEGFTANDPVTIAGGASLTGPDDGNTYTINGTDTGTISGFTSTLTFQNIGVITGGSGNDTFTFTNSGSLSGALDGGAGTGDILEGDADGNAFTITAANTGGLTGKTTGWSNIENLTGGSGGDTFSFTTAAGAISGTLTTGSGTNAINFTDDLFDLTGGNIIGTNLVGGGTDTLSYANQSEAVAVNLQAGTATGIGGTFSSVETFTGGNGSDTLTGSNTATTYTINAANAGTAGSINFSSFENLTGGTGGDTFNFTTAAGAISGTLTTGSGTNAINFTDNLFDLTGGDIIGTNLVGGGTDTLSYANQTETISVDLAAGTQTGVAGTVSSIESYVGGAGTGDTLTGTNTATTYTINALDAGTAGSIGFSGFENLTGGSGGDTFNFTTAAGAISGILTTGSGTNAINFTDNLFDLTGGDIIGTNLVGGGTDTLSYANQTEAVAVNLQAGTATGIGGTFSSIETFTAGSNTGDTLTGSNTATTYTINALNAGTAGSVAFSGFENLTGGSGGDTFNFTTAAGAISGTMTTGSGTNAINFTDNLFDLSGGNLIGGNLVGGGTDTLSYANQTETISVDLAAGTQTGVAGTVSSIEGYVGGAGTGDTLTGTNTATTYTINALNAGTAGSIGFSGFENLTGGTGGDTFNFTTAAGAISGTLTTGSGTNAINFTDNLFDLTGGDIIGTNLVGGGTDTLSYVNQTEAVAVNLQAGTATGIGGTFSSIETFTAGSNTGDTLTGSNTATTYTINALNAGTAGSVAFSGFENLTGGSGGDTFNFTTAAGAISGTLTTGSGTNAINFTDNLFNLAGNLVGGNLVGGGTDTLSYANQTETISVDLAAGTQTGVAGTVSSIEGYVGGAGTGDTLAGTNTATTYTINALNAGTVGSINFSGFENLTGGTGGDTFNFTTAAGAISGTLTTGSGTNAINFTDNLFDLTGGDIIGTNLVGGGTDTLSYANQTEAVAVNLQAGTATGIGGTFSSVETFTAGSNVGDTLTGSNTATTYTISALNTGTAGSINFSGFENLTGGSGGDTFNFTTAAGAISGTLTTGSGTNAINFTDNLFDLTGGNIIGTNLVGGGTDTLSYANQTEAVAVNLQAGTATGIGGTFSSIETFTAGSNAGDTLTGSNTATTYTINALDAGTAGSINFSGFENLTGGSGGDTFNFTAAAGAISGTLTTGSGINAINFTDNLFDLTGGDIIGTNLVGGGTDTLSYANQTEAVAVNLQTGAATGIGGTFSSIEAVTGGNGSDTFTGTNSANTWNITANNTGNIGGTTSFNSFENLVGGTLADNFLFGNGVGVSGTINGGNGTDTLNFSANATAVSVNFSTGAVTNIFGGAAAGVSNVENAIGGSVGDIFTASTTVGNTFTGNGGDDTYNVTFAGNAITTTITEGVAGGTDTVNLTGTANDDTFTLTAATTISDGNHSVAFGGNVEDVNLDTLGNSTATGDTLVGFNQVNIFNITGADAGDLGVIDFSNTENLTGGTNNDTFNFTPAGEISGTLAGGAGTTDTLNLSTEEDIITLSGTGAGSIIDIGAANVINAFTGIESIDGGGTNNNSLTGPNTAQTWNVTGARAVTVAGIGFSQIDFLNGGTAADSFVFDNTVVWAGSINGGLTGTNTLSFTNYTTGVTVDLSAGTSAQVTGGFSNIQNAIGGSAGDTFTASTTVSNTLTGNGGNDTYNVTFAGNAITTTITEAAAGGTDTVNLTGTANDDTFTLTAATTISDGNHSVAYGSNVEDVNLDTLGNSTATGDTLVGFNTANTFNITANDAGDLGIIDFSNTENLTGGSNTDAFVFSNGVALTGAINGGGGTNTLNLSAYTSAVSVNLLAATATGLGNGFSNLTVFNGGTGSNTLTGTNTGSTYNITGADDGNIGGTITFTDFGNITAGTGDDTFAFGASGSLSGNLIAAAGSDTLDLSGQSVAVTVSLLSDASVTGYGNVTGMITGIKNFTGTTASDTINLEPLDTTTFPVDSVRTINGSTPSSPTTPGDTLNYDADSEPLVTFSSTLIQSGAGGDVNYSEIETIDFINAIGFELGGTNGDDTVTLTTMGDTNIDFAFDGGASGSLTIAAGALRWQSGDGADTLIVDASGGNALITDGIIFNGGNGVGSGTANSDGLKVIGNAGFIANYTPDSTTTGNGTVSIGPTGTLRDIVFTELEPVDITGFNSVTVSPGGAADVLTVANGFDFFNGGATAALRVSGTTGGVTIETAALYGNTSVVIDTSAVDGDDTINITSASNAHGNTNFTATTGTGADVININGDMTFTGGTVTLNDAVSLGAGVNITAGTVDFNDTLNGANALTVTGNAIFDAIVGGGTALTSINVTGTSNINTTAITTTGTQTYTGAATISSNTTLTGTTVAFGNTVNSSTGTNRTLTITGNTTFANTVGVTDRLASLTVSGTTGANGGDIRTTGNQAYTGVVTLGADLALDSGAGTITATNAVTGAARTLDLQNNGGTGDVTFNGAVTVNTLTTNAQAYGVAFNAGGTITTDTNFANTGGLTLGDAAVDSITFAGGLNTGTNAGSAAGTVQTTNQQIDIGAVTLTAATTIDAGATGANINLGQITGGVNTLVLDAGTTGTITATNAANVMGNLTVTAATASITENDAITQGGAWTVTGTATLNAGTNAITLINTGNNFGTVALTANSASIDDANGLNVGASTITNALDVDTAGAVTFTGNVSVGSLNVNTSANGGAGAAITDNAGISLAVTNNATLSGTSITLGDNLADTTNFGTLTFNGTGAVAIAEDSATVLTGTNTALSLDLDSSAGITDAAVTSLSVTNNADFNGTSITLGDDAGDTTNFGTLTFNSAGAVTITEDSAMSVAGTNTGATTTLNSSADINLAGSVTVNNLFVSATGAVTDSSGVTLAVSGNADFVGSSVTVGDNAGDTVNFGTLRFASTGAVAITEDSATVLRLTNSALSLNLTSSGSITDQANTDITVTNNASFNGTAITLGDLVFDDQNFGTLTFNSVGAVTITEDSDTQITGTNTVLSLDLNSAGAITDAAGTLLTVTNNADFNGTSITLGDNGGDTTNFGTLTFNGTGAVAITEDSATVVTGTNTALSLDLNSSAGITDAAGTSLTVTNNADFNGSSITLGDNGGDTTNFGSLTFNSAGAVVVTEDSATQITGTNTALSLDLDSSAGITDAAGTSLTVTNNADFNGTSITLGDNVADTTNFGSLTFNSAGAVVVTEDSGTSIAGTNTGASLTLTSNGTIADAAGATITITGISTFNAGANAITLDSATSDYQGAVNVTGTTVSVRDVNALTLGTTVSTTNLSLQAGGTISVPNALNVGGGAGTLTIVDSAGTTFGNTVTTGTVVLTDTTGTIEFQGNLVANIGLTTANQGYAVNILGAANTIAGATTFSNTGGLQLGDAATDTSTFVGGLDTGTNAVTAAGTINTTNTNATLGAVSIIDGTSLTVDTGTGAGNIAITSITGSNTTTTGEDVTLISGTGTTTVSGAIGTDIGTLTLQENAASSTGTVALQGSVAANTLTTFAQGYAVNLTGGGTIVTATTFNNTGGVQIGDATADTTNFIGGLNTGTNAVTAAGTINTTDTDTTLGAVTIVDGQNLTVDTGTGAGNIAITSITGSNTTASGEDVTLISGTGTTTVSGAIGTDIGTLTLQENAATSTGAVSLQGDVAANALATFGQGYNVSLTGTSNTITSDTNFLNTGTLTLGDAATDTSTFAGGLATTGNATNPSAVNIAGTVGTTNAQIDLGAITLTANAVIDSGATGADINLGQITGGAFTLGLDAGTAGTITATNAANVMGNLTVTAASAAITENDAITQGGAWTVTGTATLNAGTNAITLINTGNNFGTVVLTADSASIDDANALNVGASNITNVLDVDTAGAVAFTGNVAAGSLNVDTNVNGGTGGAITQTGTLTVTGTTVLDGGDQNVTLANAGNNFVGTVDVTGADVSLRDLNALTLGTTVATNNLTLQAGGLISVPNALNVGTGAGTLTIVDSLGTTFGNTVTAGTVVLTDTTGTIAFQDDLTVNTALTTAAQGYAVSITGANNTIAGDTTFTNTGQVTIGDDATDSTTFAGGLDTTAVTGGTSIAGTVQTTNSQIDLGAAIATTNVTVDSGTAALNLASTLATGANDVTLSGDEIDLNGGAASVAGTGNLTLAPGTASSTVGVAGGAGTLDISATDLAALANGFSSITIGDATAGTGAVDVDAATFSDNINIVGGSVAVTGLNAGVNTATITARTGAITDGDGGTAAVDVTAASAALTAATGIGTTANPIETAVSTLAAQTTASGDIVIANSGGVIVGTVGTVAGLTTTGSDITLVDTGNITISADVLARSNGNVSINSTGGSITVGALVRSINGTTGSTSIGSGDITFTADSMDLGTTADVIASTGTVNLLPQTVSTTIGIGTGTTGALQFTATELAALRNGFTEIVFGLAAGTGAIDLETVAFNDPARIAGGSSLTGPDAGNTYTINGVDTGTISGFTSTLTFQNIGTITGGIGNDTFTFTTANGRLSGSLATGAGTNVVNVTADAIDLTTVNFVTGNLTGGGTDTLNFTNQSEAIALNLQNLTVTGLGGNFSSIETFGGGAATTDSITGSNTATTFNISTANAGTTTGGSVITFSSFEAITGGTANDTFNFANAGSLTGAVDGGAGTGDILNGDTDGNVFTVNGADSGTLTNTGPVTNKTSGWSNIENLNGGAGADSFVFTDTGSLSGSIDAAADSDTLDLSAMTTGVTVTLTSAGAVTGFGSVTGTITNMENFTGTTAMDTVNVQALAAATRTLDAGAPVTDVLNFDAQSTATSFSSTTIGTGVNQITYSNFESLNFINLAGLTTLTGTVAADILTLTTVDGNTINYAFTGGISGQLDGATSFQFDGADGADRLNVDGSGGGALLSGGVIYNGQNPVVASGDGLRVIGDATDDIAVYTPDATTTGNGIVTFNGVDITFTGLEPVDITGMDTVTVSPGGADDVLTVVNGVDFFNNAGSTSAGTAALVVSGSTGGTAIETVALYNNTNVIINTSTVDGDDTVNITSASNASGTTNFTVTTGAPNVGADVTNINGNVAFAGGIVTFSDEVNIGAGVNVTGTTVNFNDTVNGANALTVTGNAAFNGIVGGTASLASLNVTGTSNINTTGISTTGTQIYGGATTLSSNTTLTGSSVTFNDTLNGGQTLGVTGNAVFNGIVGGTTSLTSINVSGISGINTTDINTTSTQTYTGAATLGSTTNLTGTTVSFGNTVNGANALTVTGDADFNGAIGGGTRLTSLTVTGTTAADGGSIRTNGNQDYQGTVTLGANLALDSGTGTITTNDVTDGVGPFTLDLQDAGGTGNVTLNGVVTIDTLTTNAQAYSVTLNGDNSVIDADTNFVNTGGVTIGNEASDRIDFTGGLDTTAVTGGTTIAGRVVTENTQMDLGAVTMTADSIIRTRGAAINVASITDGGGGFTLRLQNNQVTATGAVTFAGDVTVGDIITFNQGYAVVFNEDVTTTSQVTFNNAAVTFGDATDDIATFLGGVDNNQFAGTTTNVIGTVRTAGNSLIFGATTLNGATTLDSTNNGASPAGALIRINEQITGGANTLTFNAGTAGNVTATTTNNVMGNVTVTSANDVSITENDDITQGSAWMVLGAADVDAGGNNVTLTDVGNEFGTIAVTANTATVVEANETEFAGGSVAGTYRYTSGGDVTGNVNAGTFELTTPGIVDMSGNSVGTLQNSASVGGFKFIDANGLNVSGINSGGGRLEIISVGDFNLTGNVNSGAGTLAVGSSGAHFINGGGSITSGAGGAAGGVVIYSNTAAGTVLGAIIINYVRNNITYPTAGDALGVGLLLQEVVTPGPTPPIVPFTPNTPDIETVSFQLPNFYTGLDDDDLEEFLEGFLEDELGEIEIGIINIGDGDLQVSEELLAKLKEELSTEAKQDLLDAMRSLLEGGIDIREADLPEGLIYLENSRGESVVIPLSLLFEYLGGLLSEEEKKELLDAANSL